MKELGEYLKKQRELNCVELEEAASDLKINVEDLDNLEAGNTRAFNDVLALKEIVKSYAKYLCLDSETIIDEYNDFIFEHTSKLSLEDILEAVDKEKEERKKIVSPYTYPKKRSWSLPSFKFKVNWRLVLFLITIILLFLVSTLIVLIEIENNQEVINTELKNVRREYEFT